MRMKRFVPLLPLLMLLACACTPRAPAATPSPAAPPPPTPSPSPVPVIAVAVPAFEEGFYAGFALGADASGAEIRTVSADAADALAFPGRGVLVAALSEAEPDYEPYFSLMTRGIPVLLIAPGGQRVPDGIPYIGYLAEGAARLALDAALAYPPHDTPVRMLGLFSDKSSDAYAAFQAAAKDGRVFRKDAFTGDSVEADAWMQKKLAAYYPGMLDCIYAETPELALAAHAALHHAGRDDVELFTAAVSDALLSAMRDDALLLPMAAGWNPVRAGRLARELAGTLLSYTVPENVLLTPRVFTPETLSGGWRGLSLP